MPDTETFNLITNVVTLAGGAIVSGLIIYILVHVWRINERTQESNERLESVLAPKMGIESHLNMCAQVFEVDPHGTCIVNDDGEIVLVNKRLEEITGYHRSELVGKLVEILVPDEFKGVHPRHREGFVVGPESRPMRGLKLRHKRGLELTVGIDLNHYSDATGGFTVAKVRLPDGGFRASGEWSHH